MKFRKPKNTEKYLWTRHSVGKMRQYGLSEQRIIRVIRAPYRVVKGIAENTIAVMQPASTRTERIVDSKGKVTFEKSWRNEIWVMYQLTGGRKMKPTKESLAGNSSVLLNKIIGKKIKIISAWRYPAMSKEGENLPEEILQEINEAIN